MSKAKISPMTKIWFVVSLLILFAWVIPTMVSYYKNQKLYNQKEELLNNLDYREGAQLEAKPFHSEVFKNDAKKYFEKVEVSSMDNDAYEVHIAMDKAKIGMFSSFLKNLSMDYAVRVEDGILFEDSNESINITMILKPLS